LDQRGMKRQEVGENCITLQCVLAATILTADFVVCTLAVKRKNQGRSRHVASDHSLVSIDVQKFYPIKYLAN
jgi:hypothetical protein